MKQPLNEKEFEISINDGKPFSLFVRPTERGNFEVSMWQYGDSSATHLFRKFIVNKELENELLLMFAKLKAECGIAPNECAKIDCKIIEE